MNTLLFAHITAGIVLLGLTAGRVALAARKKPRYKIVDFAAIFVGTAEFATGFGLLWQGASLAHICASSIVVVTVVVAAEVYVRRVARQGQSLVG